MFVVLNSHGFILYVSYVMYSCTCRDDSYLYRHQIAGYIKGRQVLAAKSGPGTGFGSQKWSWDRLWQSKVVLGQILAAISGPGTGFGSQKWSWDRLWQPKVVRGQTLAAKSGPCALRPLLAG